MSIPHFTLKSRQRAERFEGANRVANRALARQDTGTVLGVVFARLALVPFVVEVMMVNARRAPG